MITKGTHVKANPFNLLRACLSSSNPEDHAEDMERFQSISTQQLQTKNLRKRHDEAGTDDLPEPLRALGQAHPHQDPQEVPLRSVRGRDAGHAGDTNAAPSEAKLSFGLGLKLVLVSQQEQDTFCH
ncbi:hypothetical protein llap_11097 [Limosa lapponica baueri]|uniref:Uncharacterized protein n=1 Tax=Limosa lapponica baueri TaxID=1758121 RepID=A0A2I0TXQ3_LIMLA|nr:hypothetical protein llap_11097 [Limosa lapponica baueri]